ncbi:helix-turn-helix domain-containing protein [Streptomyces sp. NPDC004539]|uniref:AraC-like ligand-binding domain-containing protein n=1 Tax=Streptomyces sp. NPDC004539 TaxID=3154280 RepID=UPI0033A4FCEE
MDTNRGRLDAPESFEAAASSLFAPLRVTDPAPAFHASFDHTTLGPTAVAHIRATGATVTRDDRTITSTDQEWVHLTLLHSGRIGVSQDGRADTLTPGDLFVCDNTRPYRIIGDGPTDMTVLCVPRTSLGHHLTAVGRHTALAVSARSGIGGLLRHALAAGDDALPGQSAARTHLADALTALLLATFADTAPERVPVATDLADRIRVYVLAHLGDPRLSAERVARRHQLSVRYLHTLFRGADLTFTAWVRRERLLRIRRDLLDPALAGRSTAAIAARWGVLDTKHLGRALKREFGETVVDLRRRPRETPSGEPRNPLRNP